MSESTIGVTHKGPNPGALAMVFALLFNVGLSFVISFSAAHPHFPGPWESAATIAAYFRGQPNAVLLCAVLQFGAAIPLGLFTASMVSRLRFLGVRAAGVDIALFGGFTAAFNVAASSIVLWVAAYPGIAQDAAVLRMLYYLAYALGGVGYSVPLGLLMAGIAATSGFGNLLPKWLVAIGVLLGACGELSWISLLFPKALFLIPLTRFPGFIWLILAGFALPKSVASRASAN